MRWHNRFEWSEHKAEMNSRKHDITFDQAADVLLDTEAALSPRRV